MRDVLSAERVGRARTAVEAAGGTGIVCAGRTSRTASVRRRSSWWRARARGRASSRDTSPGARAALHLAHPGPAAGAGGAQPGPGRASRTRLGRGSRRAREELADRRVGVQELVELRLDLASMHALLPQLTDDQRLVCAVRRMGCAEFCERHGWSQEKYRKVAQRARARLRALLTARPESDDRRSRREHVPVRGSASDLRGDPPMNIAPHTHRRVPGTPAVGRGDLRRSHPRTGGRGQGSTPPCSRPPRSAWALPGRPAVRMPRRHPRAVRASTTAAAMLRNASLPRRTASGGGRAGRPAARAAARAWPGVADCGAGTSSRRSGLSAGLPTQIDRRGAARHGRGRAHSLRSARASASWSARASQGATPCRASDARAERSRASVTSSRPDARRRSSPPVRFPPQAVASIGRRRSAAPCKPR